MLELLGFFEVNADSATHIIILVVDWELHLLLGIPDFMILLVLLEVELDVDFH